MLGQNCFLEEVTPPLMTTVLVAKFTNNSAPLNVSSHSKLLWCHSAPCRYQGIFLELWVRNKAPAVCGSTGGSRKCPQPPCGHRGAALDLGTADGEAAEARAQLQLLSPRPEQMFPIKHWLLRCGCLADNKQQEGSVLLTHNEGWGAFSCVS